MNRSRQPEEAVSPVQWRRWGLGSVRFTVGLNELEGLFQPKWFYGSVFSFTSHLAASLSISCDKVMQPCNLG